LIALRNVIEKYPPDEEWYYVSRWYSKVFATPLHLVDRLPMLDIYRAYFSEHYEQLDEAELNKELEEVLYPKDELQKALEKSAEDSEMDKLEREAILQNQAQKKKVTPKKELKDVSNKLANSVKELGEALGKIPQTIDEGFALDFGGEL
jgi:hypothetical protein